VGDDRRRDGRGSGGSGRGGRRGGSGTGRGSDAGRSGGTGGPFARGGRGGEHRDGKGRGSAAQGDDRRAGAPARRRDLRGAAADLPNWVVEELARATPPARVADALEQLGEAAAAFTAGRYRAALKRALRAKDLAPRDATVREVLGLSAYRCSDWDTALRELRSYRRMAGDTTHLPVEMDVLRALDRDDAVRDAWEELQRRGGSPAVLKEGRVVFASHLIDRGEPRAAWDLTHPDRIPKNPFEEDLRLWYVAARSAALLGDVATAKKLRNAILEADPSFPGIDELESTIARGGR
jgi:tetratricopeptide (TPR) repeat protein